MSLDCRSYAVGLALVALGTTTLCAGDSREFERRKAPPKRTTGVAFAEPDAPQGNTNTSSLMGQKPALDALDDTIRKPFEIFRAEDSLNGAFSPQMRRVPVPPVKSKRAEAKREREKNWVFSTEEEIFGVPTAEEMLDLPEFGPNGELKAPKTRLERYLEGLERKNSGNTTNQASSDSLPTWMKPGEADDKTAGGPDIHRPTDGSGLTSSIFSSPTVEAKRPTGFDYGTGVGNGALAPTGSGSDGLFNFSSSGNLDKPVVKDTAREARMQEFKQMLDSRSLAGPSWGVTTPAPLVSPATVTPFASGAYGGSLFDSRPANRPVTLPSVAPIATTPSYFTPAPVPPATRTPMPSSSFELPKRKY